MLYSHWIITYKTSQITACSLCAYRVKGYSVEPKQEWVTVIAGKCYYSALRICWPYLAPLGDIPITSVSFPFSYYSSLSYSHSHFRLYSNRYIGWFRTLMKRKIHFLSSAAFIPSLSTPLYGVNGSGTLTSRVPSPLREIDCTNTIWQHQCKVGRQWWKEV